MQIKEYVVTATELLGNKYPPQRWLVDGVLPHPSLGELFADRGAGKTWAALSLAIAVAKGERWLRADQAVGTPRKVLYIDGEMPEDELQVRVRMLSGGEVPGLALMCLGGRKDRPNYGISVQWERLIELMEEEGYELVVLDNWSSLVRGVDENSNDETREVMDGPIMLRNNGYSVLWVHHTGKAGTQRGASAREDALDYVVELEAQGRPGDVVKFRAGLGKSRRRVTWHEPFTVELGENGDGRAVWLLAEEELGTGARRVWQALRAAKEPMTEGALRKVTKLNGARMVDAIAELKALGRIKRVGKGWVAH